MRKTFAFDVRAAIPAAWDFLWADNLRQRAEDQAREKESGKRLYGANRTYFLTATDVENQVRQFADEAAHGLARGSTGRACGRGYSGVRFQGDLQAAVRRWLQNNYRLTSHNFGRGHVSGARFRPVGEPISAQERETLARHEEREKNPRQQPVHYSRNGLNGYAACVVAMRKKQGRRMGFRPPRTWSTRDEDEVTCPRCRKLLAEAGTSQ